MKIKMLSTSAGPDGVMLADGEYDLPEAKANELIDGGYAVPIGAEADAPREKRPAPRRS